MTSRGQAGRVTERLADMTGRSPAEIEVFVGVAAAGTCAVVVLRTINFLSDLGSGSNPSRSRHRDRVRAA